MPSDPAYPPIIPGALARHLRVGLIFQVCVLSSGRREARATVAGDSTEYCSGLMPHAADATCRANRTRQALVPTSAASLCKGFPLHPTISIVWRALMATTHIWSTTEGSP